jgi:hypothetical protein
MNSHLKNFYQDDSNASDNTQNNSKVSDPSEYKKRILLLTKKLRSYERKRQQIIYQNKKEQELLNNSSKTNQNNANSNPETKSDGKNDSKNGSLNGLNVTNTPFNQSSTLPAVLTNNNLHNTKNGYRSGSFVIANGASPNFLNNKPHTNITSSESGAGGSGGGGNDENSLTKPQTQSSVFYLTPDVSNNKNLTINPNNNSTNPFETNEYDTYGNVNFQVSVN